MDLTQAWQAIRYGDARPSARLPVYGPPGWAARVGALLPEPATEAFDAHELHSGQTIAHGDVELTAIAVPHGVPAFGLRAVAGDRVLAYSGDCGPGPEVEVVAAGAGLFLCEAYRALPGEPDPPGTVKTPEQAGHAATRVFGAAGDISVVFGTGGVVELRGDSGSDERDVQLAGDGDRGQRQRV